ncbi:MAG: tetratricopeptide repeat protein, partial [Terriglobales bacterium]
ETFRALGVKEGTAQATYNRGRSYFFQNRYREALESASQALQLSQDIQDPFRVAMSQILVGWVYVRLGEFEKAAPLLQEGVRTARDRKFGELLPDAFEAQGELHWEKGEMELAREALRQGAALATEPSLSESAVEARSQLGLLEAERGNLARGLAECEAALAQARRLQHRHTVARAVVNLASVHLLRKDHARALEVLNEITSVTDRDLGLEFRSRALYLRGRALEGLGRAAEAQASFRQAQQEVQQLRRAVGSAALESFATRRDIRALHP